MDGLQLIAKYKLPRPAWQFVRHGKELKNLSKLSASVGWSVRTVAVQGAPFKDIYANRLIKSQVALTVDKFQRQLKGRGWLVVYPSWRWYKCGTLLIESKQIVLEAVKGEINDLTRRGRVDSQYIFKKSQFVLMAGDKRLLSRRDLEQIKKPLKVLPRGSYYLEWVITTDRKFMFYYANSLAAESKNLLAKYGGE